MNIFVLYHFDGSMKELSYDAKLRIKAALLYISNYKVSNIFFVGGSFKKNISGAEHMKEYYERFSIIDLPSHILGSSTTESNISAIMEIVSNFSLNDSNIVITNSYHGRRTNDLISKYKYNVRVCEAESILLRHGDDALRLEIRNYINSFKYKGKIFKECALRIFGNNAFFSSILKKTRNISYE